MTVAPLQFTYSFHELLSLFGLHHPVLGGNILLTRFTCNQAGHNEVKN